MKEKLPQTFLSHTPVGKGILKPWVGSDNLQVGNDWFSSANLSLVIANLEVEKWSPSDSSMNI